jgi:hypothetical protein
MLLEHSAHILDDTMKLSKSLVTILFDPASY